mgnify:CR=1 FL=1
MLMPRRSGYHTLLAQSGATRMTWARSVLLQNSGQRRNRREGVQKSQLSLCESVLVETPTLMLSGFTARRRAHLAINL